MSERGNKGTGWTKERDDALRAMVKADMSTREIGKKMGLDHSLISRRITTLDLRNIFAREERRGASLQAAEEHIRHIRTQRRGFHVPPHLERDYHELLKSGVTIAEARRRLGIGAQPENRGE